MLIALLSARLGVAQQLDVIIWIGRKYAYDFGCVSSYNRSNYSCVKWRRFVKIICLSLSEGAFSPKTLSNSNTFSEWKFVPIDGIL